LIDLGKWFGEEHAIAEPLSPEAVRNLEPPGNSRESREEDEN
jgi:endogenous inhibitor of DNA gyrase (YacG/DUF329 family)